MKTETATHTPTPWKKEINVRRQAICIFDQRTLIAEVPAEQGQAQCEANAAFIVRAVNVHDDLLSIAKAYLEFMSADPSMPKDHKRFVKQAIAKAEGRS